MGVIAKQSIQGTIVTYLGVAIGFVTTFFVLTRFLTTEEIGLSRVLVDAATLFVGLAQLGTNNSVIRFFPYFRGGKERLFFRMAMLLPLIGFGLMAIIYTLCYTPLSHWFGEKSPLFVQYYYAVLPLSFFILYECVFEVCANVRMKIVVPRAVKEIGTRLLLLAVYLLYSFRILSMDGFVMAICLSYAICALVDGTYFLYIERRRPSADDHQPLEPGIWGKMARYTLFLVVASLTGTLAPLLSSFFITAEMGLNYTGIFAIATYISVMVSIPYRSLTSIASPQLATAIRNGDRAAASRLQQQAATNLQLIGGFILMAIWINIDLIFHILPNGETYANARYVVLLLGLSQWIVSTFQICVNGLNFSGHYGWSLAWSIVLTLLSIFLNNLLIPRFGMNGAALSNIVSYAVYHALVVLTLAFGTHTHPFAKSQLYTIALLVVLFILNYLLLRCLPLGIWGSSIVRSVLLLGGGCAVAYAGKFSPELDAVLHKIFIRRH